MKRSMIAGHMLLLTGLALLPTVEFGCTTPTQPRPEATQRIAQPSACRQATWPYLPAACGGRIEPRPVRLVRVDRLG